ncbi:NUDIX domain-containing protein [Corynebacterium kalidii]|jgi:8-oxo-dGTP pyrophosphatase MutT (NUDIX family)
MSRRSVEKAVGYVVHQRNLLVFTHDDFPMEVTGVQVPAGSIAEGESPGDAVVREVREETGLAVRIVRSLGVESYDMWPSKPEVHERHFFQLGLVDGDVPVRWKCGENDASNGGLPVSWTCWWMALRDAHVLCAGFGARLGGVGADDGL